MFSPQIQDTDGSPSPSSSSETGVTAGSKCRLVNKETVVAYRLTDGMSAHLHLQIVDIVSPSLQRVLAPSVKIDGSKIKGQ
jgi:hypothetical protein